MRKSSHGFNDYGTMKIIDAAKEQAKRFLENENKEDVAIRVMSVVLGANRNWEKQVQPHLDRMKKEFPKLTFKDLKNMLSEKDYVQFKEVWGHKDKKKYDVLTALIDRILTFENPNSALDDFGIMKKWAYDAKLSDRKEDRLGSIPNIGIATFQHLRMAFGVDTIKPDQRVKEVLDKEFDAKLSSEKAILAVEEIARITEHKIIEIDQIFVKYGSGYYKPASSEGCTI